MSQVIQIHTKLWKWWLCFPPSEKSCRASVQPDDSFRIISRTKQLLRTQSCSTAWKIQTYCSETEYFHRKKWIIWATKWSKSAVLNLSKKNNNNKSLSSSTVSKVVTRIPVWILPLKTGFPKCHQLSDMSLLPLHTNNYSGAKKQLIG